MIYQPHTLYVRTFSNCKYQSKPYMARILATRYIYVASNTFNIKQTEKSHHFHFEAIKYKPKERRWNPRRYQQQQQRKKKRSSSPLKVNHFLLYAYAFIWNRIYHTDAVHAHGDDIHRRDCVTLNITEVLACICSKRNNVGYSYQLYEDTGYVLTFGMGRENIL